MTHSNIISLDVHKATIHYCILKGIEKRPTDQGVFNNEETVCRRRLKSWSKKYPEAIVLYEAGGCGYKMFEWAVHYGLDCQIIAPSSLRRKPNYRKTDKNDALDLALAFRNEKVTAITVPDPEMQALRAFMKYRHSTSRKRGAILTKIKLFLNFYNLKIESDGPKVWIDRVGAQAKLLPKLAGLHLLSMLHDLRDADDRLEQLDREMHSTAKLPEIKPMHDALVSIKGIGTVTALTLISTIIDIRRFKSPYDLMIYLGLTPRPWQSGKKKTMKGISKACSRAVMVVMTEAAGSQKSYYRATTRRLNKDRAGLHPELIRIADKAGYRLHSRYHHLLNRGKHTSCARIAVARELAGFVWAMLMKVLEITDIREVA